MMDKSNVVVERIYEVPVKKVWNAITKNDQMKQWYFDLEEFRLEVGFQFQFLGQGQKGEQYVHLCTITEIEPLKKLQYSWKYKGYSGHSFVTFELFDLGNRTKLRLTHSGLESFPKDKTDFDSKCFDFGWNEIIGKNLTDFLLRQ